eukprot:PhM_4_TR18842/c0_g1_i1/m.100291
MSRNTSSSPRRANSNCSSSNNSFDIGAMWQGDADDDVVDVVEVEVALDGSSLAAYYNDITAADSTLPSLALIEVGSPTARRRRSSVSSDQSIPLSPKRGIVTQQRAIFLVSIAVAVIMIVARRSRRGLSVVAAASAVGLLFWLPLSAVEGQLRRRRLAAIVSTRRAVDLAERTRRMVFEMSLVQRSSSSDVNDINNDVVGALHDRLRVAISALGTVWGSDGHLTIIKNKLSEKEKELQRTPGGGSGANPFLLVTSLFEVWKWERAADQCVSAMRELLAPPPSTPVNNDRIVPSVEGDGPFDVCRNRLLRIEAMLWLYERRASSSHSIDAEDVAREISALAALWAITAKKASKGKRGVQRCCPVGVGSGDADVELEGDDICHENIGTSNPTKQSESRHLFADSDISSTTTDGSSNEGNKENDDDEEDEDDAFGSQFGFGIDPQTGKIACLKKRVVTVRPEPSDMGNKGRSGGNCVGGGGKQDLLGELKASLRQNRKAEKELRERRNRKI